MIFNHTTGLFSNLPFISSPNYNERPLGKEINLLVIHGISLPKGKFGGPYIQQLFTNQLDLNADPSFIHLKDLKVSSHLLIRRTGEMIQFVSLFKSAWHAGVSSFQGRENCNDFSIGIELEGTDDLPYEAIQYEKLISLTKAIQSVYSAITKDNIVGHADIAPGRKTDPGVFFDWARFRDGF